MKLGQYLLIYLSIAMVFLRILDLRISVFEAAVKETRRMNETVGAAADDALVRLISYDGGGDVKLRKESAVERFFLSMWSGLGILEDGYAKEALYGYFPVIAVTDYDGFYIRYSKKTDSGGEGAAVVTVWTDKIYYIHEDELLICRFERDDTVLILDKAGILTGEKYKMLRISYRELEGEEYSAFQKAVPNHFLLSEESFYSEKRSVLTQTLERELRYYTSAHNRIAEMLGISYDFAFPDEDGSSVLRAVPDLSFLAVFQGYPLKGSGQRPYERVLLAGSYLDKREGETVR